MEDRMVLTAEEQRRLDALALECGAAPDLLIESAGRSAADWVLEHARVRRVAVFAGPGGNGADALVVARRVREAGVEVEVFLLASEDAPSPATARALDQLRAAGGDALLLGPGEVDPARDLRPARRAVAEAGLVIDGLYGSGLSHALDGTAAAVVRLLNDSSKRIVSLDVPSGVAANRGDVPGPAVRAAVTLAMEFLKPAHLFSPAAELCGNVAVVEVAYPEAVRAVSAPWARVLDRAGARRRLPVRALTGHKGTFGHVVLVAGSSGMVGAAILAGRAALRAGAGLLTIGIPASQAAAVHVALPEALVSPLAERDGHLVSEAAEQLGPVLRRADVLAIGPGLSRSEDTCAAAAQTIEGFAGPAVVDADAFYALLRHPSASRGLAGRGILTPHPGELSLLTGVAATEIDRDRAAAAPAYARKCGAIVVLKGRPTVIALPDGRIYLNPTGNAGLATGGSGDVLTGVLAGLIAGGVRLEDAGVLGPYVHGLAAELYGVDRSERSLLPSDVVDLLPRAFREVERCG